MVALHLEKDQAQAQQPGTGIPISHTHARLRAEPHRSQEPQPSPDPLASSFIHSFKNSYYTLAMCQAMLQMLGSESQVQAFMELML